MTATACAAPTASARFAVIGYGGPIDFALRSQYSNASPVTKKPPKAISRKKQFIDRIARKHSDHPRGYRTDQQIQ